MRNDKGQFVKGHTETSEEKEYRKLALKKAWLTNERRHSMYGTRFYNSWRSMTTRCRGTAGKDSIKKYKDKGIIVCDKWLKFKGFMEDMLPSYKEGLTIERIDNYKGYTIDNCRWATLKEQANNKTCTVRINHEGKEYTLLDIAEMFGKTPATIRIRYYRKYRTGLIDFNGFSK